MPHQPEFGNAIFPADRRLIIERFAAQQAQQQAARQPLFTNPPTTGQVPPVSQQELMAMSRGLTQPTLPVGQPQPRIVLPLPPSFSGGGIVQPLPRVGQSGAPRFIGGSVLGPQFPVSFPQSARVGLPQQPIALPQLPRLPAQQPPQVAPASTSAGVSLPPAGGGQPNLSPAATAPDDPLERIRQAIFTNFPGLGNLGFSVPDSAAFGERTRFREFFPGQGLPNLGDLSQAGPDAGRLVGAVGEATGTTSEEQRRQSAAITPQTAGQGRFAPRVTRRRATGRF